jgi:hypothetical protein
VEKSIATNDLEVFCLNGHRGVVQVLLKQVSDTDFRDMAPPDEDSIHEKSYVVNTFLEKSGDMEKFPVIKGKGIAPPARITIQGKRDRKRDFPVIDDQKLLQGGQIHHGFGFIESVDFTVVRHRLKPAGKAEGITLRNAAKIIDYIFNTSEEKTNGLVFREIRKHDAGMGISVCKTKKGIGAAD